MPSLHHSSDRDPGITREPSGNDFRYLYPDRTTVSRGEDLDRIAQLVIPPAYQDVWICLSPQGHLQATGRDAKSRKQYRYHPDWRKQRQLKKFNRLAEFGQHLPSLRRKIRAALKGEDGERQRALAIALRLMDKEGLRVGSEIYLESNGTRGASTLGKKNIEFVEPGHLALHFTAKGGRKVDIDLNDRLLDQALQRCHELPGQRLLSYHGDDGEIYDVDSGKLNHYLKSLCDEHFSVKDLRTWRASASCVEQLLRTSERDPEKAYLEAVKFAAKAIRNRYTTCRKYYIHPAIITQIDRVGIEALQKANINAISEMTTSEAHLLSWLEND